MDDISRRDVLKLGLGAGASAWALAPDPAAAQTAPASAGLLAVAADRDGPHRHGRHWPAGRQPRRELPEDPALPDHRGVRHPRGAHDLGAPGHRRSRPSRADGLCAWAARFRAALRDRRSGSRLHRHAVGVARAGHAGRDEERQARRDRSAGGDVSRRLLGHRRGRRETPSPCGDDGELQLRPPGDDGLQHRPAATASATSCTRKAATCTTCARSSSSGATKACGGAHGRRSSMAIRIRRTGSARSPTASTSTAAIASTTWCR